MSYVKSLFCLLLISGGLHAQSNYRPHGSKNTDHSYFKNGTVSFVNSSHQDIAWMDSIAACEQWRDEKMITPALDLLKRNPAYCFSVEDALSLREYLARHPDRYDDILKYTKEGRLEWGGTYNMPYESMYDGEALVRETYLGRKWLKKMLPGCSFTTAWNEDVPGKALQMSQILSKAGIKYLYISRHEAGIYRWYSPDSSNVLMYTPGHYDGSGRDIWDAKVKGDSAKAGGVLAHVNAWSVYYKTNKMKPALPILIDTDWGEPNDFPSLFQYWNQRAKAAGLPALQYGTAAGTFKALDAPHAKYEPLRGERPNVWLYIHGPTHERALSASRKANRTLVAAEAFSAIDATLKKDLSQYPQSRLNSAWEKAIYPDHGWGGKHGDMTDLTFRTKFEDAYAVADTVLRQSLINITGAIGFPAAGRSVVVFNPLSHERSDKVEASVKVYGQDTLSYQVIDATTGQEVTSQLVKSEHADEAITLCWVAEKVPSFGYKSYILRPYVAGFDRSGVPVRPTHPAEVDPKAEAGVYENKFYRIQFGPGGLKSIFDKGLQAELLKTDRLLGGEVFQMQSVGNGAGEFSDVQPVTMDGFEKVGQYNPVWNCTEFGPVRKTWELVQQTRFATIRQTVTLYESLKQIDFKADILGFSGERYREYRMAFPLNQTASKVAYEVPMGVVEVGKDEIKGAAGFSYGTQDYSTECSKVHPREVQDWFSASKDNVNVAISSSVVVFDWIDATDSNNRSTVLQPILLASRKSCHSEGNYYLQSGSHHFEFSLTSSAGDWKNTANAGKQQNQPLRAVVTDVPQARTGLPSSYSFAGVNADNVLITAIKKSEDENSIVMRLVDMQGKQTSAAINWFGPITGVTKTNIIEEDDQPMSKAASGIEMPIKPYSIETIRVR